MTQRARSYAAKSPIAVSAHLALLPPPENGCPPWLRRSQEYARYDLYSSADDSLRFLTALMRGELFADSTTYGWMEERRNRVIWPLIHYGLGMMHFKIGRLNAPGRRPLSLVGHTGSTGSWLFYCPELDVFTTGTVDEVRARAFPFRFMPKLFRAIVD